VIREDHVDSIFLYQIETQCKYAIESLKKIDKCMQPDANDNILWQEIQNLLVSLANISKILDPVKDKYKKRGYRLRNKLGITFGSAILKRNCRNYFEHYDEKIEEWALKNNGIYIDCASFSKVTQKFSVIPEGSVMRTFDYDKWEVTYGSEVFAIKPIIDELIYLYKKVTILKSET
jgi:hypothetical protein